MFGFALIAGLLMTPERRLMASRWFFIGGMVAFLIFLPNLIWMIQHHFPHLEMLANIKHNRRNVALSPLEFFGLQVLSMQPVALPIWICGLWAFLFSDQGRAVQGAWAGIPRNAPDAVGLQMGGSIIWRPPILCCWLAAPSRLSAGRRRRDGAGSARIPWLAGSYRRGNCAVVLPLLPPETYIRYTHFIGISQPKFENRKASALPQLLADRLVGPKWLRPSPRSTTICPRMNERGPPF